jgi:hypothetical protein
MSTQGTYGTGHGGPTGHTETQQIYGSQSRDRGNGVGDRLTDRRKPFFMTSEFLTMVALVIATLVAAAVADNFGAPRAWTLVTVLGAAYIVSRGLSKAGTNRGGADY